MKLNFKNIALVLLGLILVNTVQTYVLYIMRKFGDLDFYSLGLHIFIFINSVLSLISTVIAWKILHQFSKGKRAILTFLVSFFIFSIFTSLFFLFERNLINGLSTSVNMLIGNIVTSFITSHLYISAYTIAYLYFAHSKDLEINIERLENEKIQLNANLLKQNLEPHFLFNNLSVLSGLVKKNPEKVDDFMDSFSEVYRYYLKHNQENAVSIAEEISFLENYMHLMNARFGNAYECKIYIDDKNGFVLPCSLQLCVENAIKHNAASENQPLMIEVFRNNNEIIIKNPLRKVDFTKSNGIGNEYLKRRYEIEFGKNIETQISENEHLVKIPII